MTTSLTSTSLPAAAIPAPASTTSRLRQVVAGRTRLLIVVAAVGLVMLPVAVSRVANWRRGSSAIAGNTIYTVSPKTFNVALKEKGELKAAKSTEVICEVEGKSTIISLIPEGTAVKTGDLLVELASDQIVDRIRETELKEANAITVYEAAKTELDVQRDKNLSDIRKAKLQIELKDLELKKYQKGDWAQRTKDAEIAIEQAQINLKRRTEDFEASKELRDRKFITDTEYKEDEFNFQKAQWELEKALKAKEVLEAYTHVADLRQRESDLEEATKEFDRVKKNAEAEETKKVRELEGKKKELELIQDQLAKLRTQREKCHIVAPTDGFVVYHSDDGGRFMSSESQIREGGTVHERQILLTLPNTSEMQVVVRIHEAKTDRLALGQIVRIQVEGLPGQEFSGTVSKIAVVADTQNRWLNPDLKEYETEITLDPTDGTLKPGVTAYCEILVDSVENKVAVPVHTIYSKGMRRFVFASQSGKVAPVEVRLGSIGTEWAEITSGLSGGETVLLSFTDAHKRLIQEPRGNERDAQGQNAGGPTGPAGASPDGGRRIQRGPGAPGGPQNGRNARGGGPATPGAAKKTGTP